MSDDESDSSSSSSGSEREEKVEEKAAPVVKKKAVRKKKDNTGPKKPLSAYMFFCKARRAELKAENPAASFCELGKKLGQEWKAMEADDRTEYTDQAEQDKVRYADEGGKKRKKKAGGPKRALSAYMFFSQETRPILKEEDASLGFAELGKEIGARWKQLEDKSRFHAMAEEDKVRYAKDVEADGGAPPPAAKKKKAAKAAPPPPPEPESEEEEALEEEEEAGEQANHHDDNDDSGSGSGSGTGSDSD